MLWLCTVQVTSERLFLLLQKKKVRRRRNRPQKKSTTETDPEVLEETWKIVSEELRAAGFQVIPQC